MSRDDRLRLAFAALHPDRTRGLVERFGGATAVVSAIAAGEIRVPEEARRAVAIPASARRRLLAGAGISFVFREDPGFPDHLRRLPDSPDLLFARGRLPRRPGVALVGTRRATRYGLVLAAAFGARLAAAGWPVVSGLARGIDVAAHRGTVDAGGVGIAVFGCGIDRWYPVSSRATGERLLDTGGSVVSEYPPGTAPHGWRFPPRNRIISGLSRVVVVVEAAATGGALVTARAALAQGRDVFAVPGDVNRTTSEGCNLLIRDGAWPVFDPDDLVESVERVLGPAPGTRRHDDADAEDPLLSAVGPAGAELSDLVGDVASTSTVLAGLARLEAAGLVRISGGLVTRTGRSPGAPADPPPPAAGA